MNTKQITTISASFLTLFFTAAIVCASPVPDTGQTQSYTNTFGEDADYTINQHSYTDLGNGIVRDNITGLEWQKVAPTGTYTWANAVTYCDNLVLGSKSDWRLPTIKELSTLVDRSIPSPGPTISTIFFPGTVAAGYWSSTTYAYGTTSAWAVHFSSGSVRYSGKTSSTYVRAVRSGQ